ncbi:MAG: CPBP family intramembrane metalloprotease [Acidobacteriota bacterium]|nr:MAG: CPBP family intramembrane metalloprotease [Acidobacteriota bacterium]
MSRIAQTWKSPWLIGSIGLYLCSLAAVSFSPRYGVEDALTMIVVFGVVLSGTALLITRGVDEREAVKSPGVREMALVLGLVTFVAVYLVWGVGVLDSAASGLTGGSARAAYVLNIARKLLIFVVIPLAALRLFTEVRRKDIGLARGSSRLAAGRLVLLAAAICVPILLLQFIAGSAAKPLFEGAFTAGELILAVPLCFAVLVFEVGLVEEIFYRVILQSRLSAYFRSEAAGIAVASLIFALSHSPGLILRGGDAVGGAGPAPAPIETIAYTIATLTLPAVMFGIIWSRSRSLPVLVVIHAITDIPPSLPEFVKTFLR